MGSYTYKKKSKVEWCMDDFFVVVVIIVVGSLVLSKLFFLERERCSVCRVVVKLQKKR